MLLTVFLLPGITVEFEYLDLTMTEVRCIALHGIMRGWCIRATGKKQTTRRRKKKRIQLPQSLSGYLESEVRVINEVVSSGPGV